MDASPLHALGIATDATGRVATPEGKTVEYKRDLSSPDRVARCVVAFANSAGGLLMVGIDDDGTVLGVADPGAESERVANVIADRISPRLVPNIEVVTANGKAVVLVQVFLSGSRPHYVAKEGLESGVYVRLGPSNRQADQYLIADLRRSVSPESYDSLPRSEFGIDVLDREALSRMLGRDDGGSDATLLTLGLAAEHQGRLVPTNAGILLIGTIRERVFRDAWVQVGRFRGEDKSDLFDQADVSDYLPLMPDAVMAFLTKHAFKMAEFGQVRRKDSYSIPVDSVREVVVNALAHSDYAARGSRIRVAFYDSSIEVDSMGGLVPGMTLEMMKGGVSKPRNPVIARVFREMDLMEEWGSGVKSVFADSARRGLPEPTITEYPGVLRFTIPIENHRPVVTPLPGAGRHGEHQVSAQEQQVKQQVKQQVEVGTLTEVQVMLLAGVKRASANRAEVLAAAGLSNDYRAFQRHVVPLLDSGLMAMTSPDKPKSRSQRYQLTAAGREALSHVGEG